MKKMLLILLIPLSVFGKTSLEQYQSDLRKSDCSSAYSEYTDFYHKTINRCDLINRVYQVKSDCRKQTDEIMKKKIKECVKKYQDRTWWDKL
jgi:hypothetical protein